LDRQPYRVETTERAMKEFLALPSPVQERLNAVVKHLAIDPRPRGCVKLETFKNAFRVRAGDYRVIYVVDDEAEVVTITKFGHRGSVYRRG
jgi:mRNA interferase RelE/StbE